ncbi:MAG: cytochrome c oxidase accessory protein CcoG [Candidatus Polarisedimenticolaceae bacterium]|nr:cytochrome c oxidase accessory protein CcoG [Candidatus Polarisedimenticolaceae bacterium]
MSKQPSPSHLAALDDLLEEAEQWHVNAGDEIIHAKRMGGKWRTIKWLSGSIWLLLFFGPYLRWNDRQAILWDIPNRQFHLFNITILPQDLWMLALLLLFLAIMLFAITAFSGRVWCGFLCFQTVWTDIYTWIEEKCEGTPQQRRKLDQAPMDLNKFGKKLGKHTLWMLIAIWTGISFVAWFTDVYLLWGDLFRLQLSSTAWITILLFTVCTYLLAAFMREQLCMWVCPYARIQGAMVDVTTIVPAYDFHRGEPRSRMKKGDADEHAGDCVDCNQCVAVCPTGVDIRRGQQEGCIMCALCIDACDLVMDKIGRPRGLIRYESLNGLEGKACLPVYKQPRIVITSLIMLAALLGIFYGLSSIDAIDLKVLHARQPLYVLQSDGSIQNKYTLKILNKLADDVTVKITATGPAGLKITSRQLLAVQHGTVTPTSVFVRVPRKELTVESQPIIFHIETVDSDKPFSSHRESVFIGPKR